MRTKFVIFSFIITTLTACGSDTNTPDGTTIVATTASGFGDGSSQAAFVAELDGNDEIRSGSFGLGVADGPGGYRFAIAQFNNADTVDYRALAALQPATRVSGPVTGTVRYNARYDVVEVQNVLSNPGIPDDQSFLITGAMTMTANFADQTIAGTSDLLTIGATLNADSFDGTVTWRGVDGVITGLASDDLLIGAFHGSDDDSVFAGGIEGRPTP